MSFAMWMPSCRHCEAAAARFADEDVVVLGWVTTVVTFWTRCNAARVAADPDRHMTTVERAELLRRLHADPVATSLAEGSPRVLCVVVAATPSCGR